MNSLRRSWVAIGILAALAGCDSNPGTDAKSESTRWLRYPLVAFESDSGWRAVVEGDLETARIRFGPERPRALVARRGAASLSFRLDELAGGVLRTRAAVVPAQARSRGSASFRITAHRKATREPFRQLFVGVLEVGEQREIEIALPPDAARVRLEIQPTAELLESHAWAAWLEPVIERETPRPPLAPDRPSLLLVTVDTLRADVLGTYGGRVATPSLDRLADRGVRFLAAHSVAFGTTPSHASLLTARPVSTHGVVDNLGVLRNDEVTLAEVLAARGYHTGAFVSGLPLARRHGLHQGFDVYDDAFIADVSARLFGTARSQRRADATRQQFSKWLRTVPSDEPFFAWIHWFDPHQPYDPPQSASPHPRRLQAAGLIAQGEAAFRRAGEQAVDRYRAEVAFVDRELGLVLDELVERGRWDRSVVVFTADHGETLLDRAPRLAFDHATLFAEVTRIPLVISAPGDPPGVSVPGLVASTDVAPTLLALLGIPTPEAFEGRDLSPWRSASPPPEPPHSHLVLEGARRRQIAVRTNEWLYRRARTRNEAHRSARGFENGGGEELHSVVHDPQATINVANDRPEVVERLRALANFPTTPTAPTRLEPDAAQRRALESLGYVEE